MFIIIIQLLLALLAVLFLWSVFFTDQFEEGSVMKAGNLGFRIIYSIYTNTRLGSWYTKRKLNEARLKYPLGHSYLKTFTYNHIQILPIAVNQDNYTYLVIDSNTNDAVLIDVSDTETVLATLKANFVQPKAILSTHKHWDHCCGNKEMLRQFPDMKIYGSRIDKPSGVSNRVADGETFSVGSLKFSAHVMPGHTRGHVLFRLFGDSTKDMPDCLFTGDMLFLGGTGKMFECSPKTMLESLERLSEFGDDSLVWPGHEYALDNLQFAKLIDSKNENVASKKAWVKIQREQGQPTCCAFRDEMRRRLRLGYVQVVPPYLYSCGLSKNWRLCRRPGLTIELWRAIGDALNYDFDFVQAPEYGKLLNGKWTGLMGLLTNHSIDATVTFMGMTPERLKVVNYSTPVAAVQPGFVDTRVKRILHEKLLYQVFDPLTFVFLFLSTSIFGLALAYQVHSWADGAWIATAGAFQKMRLKQKTFGNLVSIVGYVFFIYSYSAGFQSQAICPSTLAEERLYNPFLRTSDCSLLRALHIIDEDDPSDAPIAFGLRVTALKMIRKRKDDLAATKP
uniref:Metallo-beta-lactamase domain-containing protein n=1 Tax=Plectus sambesii TaxID=2011161 RepID=A0A914WIW4_9BILA